MKTNSPDYWDGLWSKQVSLEDDAYSFAREEHGIRWARIMKAALSSFQTLKGLRVVEIGAGAGTNAALMAKKGAEITILDNSRAALKRSREFFSRNGLSATYIEADALNLPEELLNQFDISMSFGLAEHFKGPDRMRIIKTHFDLLNPSGMTFISVPNKLNLPYMAYKTIFDLFGKFPVEEYPFTRKELTQACTAIGIKSYCFFGDSLYSSLNWLYCLTYRINPLVHLESLLGIHRKVNVARMQYEKGSCLDEWLSYALVLCGRKQK